MEERTQSLQNIFCHGPLLHAVQTISSEQNTVGIFVDSKHFVDMSLRAEPEVILEHFERLSQSSLTFDTVKAFVEEFFNEPDDELEVYHPPNGFEIDDLALYEKIADTELQWWAQELIRLWPVLCRQVKDSVRAHPHRHSLLPRLHPMVIPGGRFRETYYWDSYWIVRGLLISGLQDMAIGMVENLLDDVKKYGFVPNGSRIYYLNRSQPPLLSEMVAAVFKQTADHQWLSNAVQILQQEYAYWMSGDKVLRIRKDMDGSTIESDDDLMILNRYHVTSSQPRPESYREDLAVASCSSPMIYQELATAAESGWDFSCRWMARQDTEQNDSQSFHLSRSIPTCCVPVDLNCILFRMENNMSNFHSILGSLHNDDDDDTTQEHAVMATKFKEFALRREKCIEEVLWDNTSGRWKDAWLNLNQQDRDQHNDSQNIFTLWNESSDSGLSPPQGPFLSDFACPLWAGLADRDHNRQTRVISSLTESGLLGDFGVATSVVQSDQQWDSPNAWPPLVEMLVEGLERLTGNPSSQQATSGVNGPEVALKLAQQYISTAFANFGSRSAAANFMYEKYDVNKLGMGSGGEYSTQVGFGWSNGTALIFLERYGQSLTSGVNREH